MPYNFSNDGLHSIELIKELGDPFLIQSMISSFFHYDGIQFSQLVDLAFLKSLARNKNLFAFSVCFFILLHLALNSRKYSREIFGSVHLLLKQNGFERRKQASNDSLIKIQSVSVLRNENTTFWFRFYYYAFIID